MYSGASVLLKVGGGLSHPVPVQLGIGQGCLPSGMIYALAIEPLLNKLRNGLSEVSFSEKMLHNVSLSAHADDITVSGRCPSPYFKAAAL